MKKLIEKIEILNIEVSIEHNDDSTDKFGIWAIFEEGEEKELVEKMKAEAKYITASIYNENGSLKFQGKGKDNKEAISNLFQDIASSASRLATVYAYDVMFNEI